MGLLYEETNVEILTTIIFITTIKVSVCYFKRKL